MEEHGRVQLSPQYVSPLALATAPLLTGRSSRGTPLYFKLCPGKRFGRRNRPYVQHQAKSVSYPLLQEVALVWKDMIAWTGGHAFRETVDGDGDFYQMFVLAHYIVERAREAMLWAWVVGRIGALDDSWGQYEHTRAWVELGGGWDDDAAQMITVESDVRETLDEDRVRAYLKEGGIEGEFHTKYLFCESYVLKGRGCSADATRVRKRHSMATPTTSLASGGSRTTSLGSRPRAPGSLGSPTTTWRKSGSAASAPSSGTSASASGDLTGARRPRARSSSAWRLRTSNAATAVGVYPEICVLPGTDGAIARL